MNSRSSQRAGISAMCLTGRNFRRLALLLTFVFGLCFHALAQDATIVGTVTDPSGSVVPNVTVTLVNIETGQTRTSTTNEVGQYVAPGLSIGHYNISAAAAGFGTTERNGLVLAVGDRTRVDFSLKV